MNRAIDQRDDTGRVQEDLAPYRGTRRDFAQSVRVRGSDEDAIRESVDIVQEFVRKLHIERLAGLVDKGFNFGVGRQFEILTDVAGGHGFRLFNDEQLALRWLSGEPL